MTARDDDRVHRQIHEAITDRRLPPGTKLVEQALADALSVSRARVRAALARLALEKMVVIEPNRGASVAVPTVAEAREVFQARRLVEDFVARTLAGRMNAEMLAALHAHVAEEEAARARRDRSAVIRLSGAFHQRLADLAGNRILAEMLAELISRSSLVIAVHEMPGTADCSHHDHTGLLDALGGTPEQAAAAMSAHLDEIEAGLDLSMRPDAAVDLSRVFAGARRTA